MLDAAPPTAVEHPDWAYGIGKRDVEDVFAGAPFLTTRLRIPMVSGEGDPKQRYEKPSHGRWTIRAILEGSPHGENGVDLAMLEHAGRFPLYPAERCVTRIAMLQVCPPSPPPRR